MKNEKLIKKIIIFVLSILTIFRIYLSIKMPLYFQAASLYDDFLFVEYSNTLRNLHWLGLFGYKTLAKTISFSLFLNFVDLSHLPYQFVLITLYIISIIVFSISFSKLVNKKYFGYILYLVLLFSPVMFHEENVQKVYRGGLIVCTSILVLSYVIGHFCNFKDNKKLIFYTIIGIIFLPFFYYIKEDSIWIMPFVIVGSLFTIFYIFKLKIKLNYKLFKCFLVILPILSLVLCTTIYKYINYKYYGVFATVDRSDTYFKDFIHDLLLIEDANTNRTIWVSKSSFDKAASASKTLNKYYDCYNKMYGNEEVIGDIIYWAIKDSFKSCGLYDKDGKYVNNFYKKIHLELTQAFESGKLKKNNYIYVSSVARGITGKDDIIYLKDSLINSFISTITYKENIIKVNKSTGDINNINLMKDITNSYSEKYDYNIIHTENIIVNLYKNSSIFLLIASSVGFIIFIIRLIIRKDKNYNLLIVTLGLLLSAFILHFGVTYFCMFLNTKKIYDYLCAFIPIIQVFEITFVYYLLVLLKNTFIKNKSK